MTVTNRRLVDFDGADFYPTPSWATKALMAKEKFEGTILEPCCGDGAISNVLEQTNEVISTDKYDRGFGHVKDAFDYDPINFQVDNIVTNPPFAIANELVLHFLKITNNKLCLLLRTAFLESAKRYNTIFKEYSPQRVYVFSQRLSMYHASQKGVNGGGTTSYSWFVWDKKNKSMYPEIRWIEPGFKE